MTPAPISVERLRELLDKALDGVTVAPSGCVSFPTETAHLSVSFLAKHGAALLHQLAERDAEVERLKAQAEEDRELKLVAMEVAQDISTCIPFLPPVGQRNIRKCVDRLIAAFLAASGEKVE